MSRCLLFVAALIAAPLAAQAPGAVAGKRFSLDGEAGSDGEVYRISGRTPRRPGESARVFFNPSVRAGSFTIGGNFLLSTEGSSTLGLGGLPGRQRINQFGLTPRWGWGLLHLGSFTDTYTPLTWTGVRVDGAGFDLTPGKIRAGLFTGKSREPVFGGATSGSFSRSLLGARVGVGRRPEYGTGGTYLDLVFLRARDDPASLPAVPDSLTVPFLPDSLAVEPDTALLPRVPINPYSVTPQENAVLSTSAGATFLGGAVVWKGELAGSIHSRDVRATRVDDDVLSDYPGILRGLVTPRAGTHADYAYESQLDVRIARLPGATTRSPRSLTASIGLRSVGAGYVSLGTAYLPNDIRGIDWRTALRFRRWSLQLDGLRQRDNLLSQKLATTYRTRLGAALVVQPVRGWHSSFRAATVGMDRDVPDSVGAIDYAARSLSTSHSWIPGNKGRIRSVTAMYTYQHIGDADPLRAASTLRSHTADVRVSLAVGPTATISPTLGIIESRVGAEEFTTRASYGISADWRDPRRRWTTSGSLSRSQVSRTSALTARFSARVSVTSVDQLTLVVRTNRYRSLIDHGLDFDEQVINLKWSRRL
jgi:hypothetical protein